MFGLGLTKDSLLVVRLIRRVESLEESLNTYKVLYKSAKGRATYWRERGNE